MRTTIIIFLFLALVGCSASPSAVASHASKPPPPDISGTNSGSDALKAYTWCLDAATREAPGYSNRAVAFQNSFVKSCMLTAGISPEYISVLVK